MHSSYAEKEKIKLDIEWYENMIANSKAIKEKVKQHDNFETKSRLMQILPEIVGESNTSLAGEVLDQMFEALTLNTIWAKKIKKENDKLKDNISENRLADDELPATICHRQSLMVDEEEAWMFHPGHHSATLRFFSCKG
jgi:hypothetical protein